MIKTEYVVDEIQCFLPSDNNTSGGIEYALALTSGRALDALNYLGIVFAEMARLRNRIEALEAGKEVQV